jgi:hypothetical protein
MKTPTGLDALVAFRSAGKLPNRIVSLNVGDDWKSPNWYKVPEFLKYPSGVIRSTDAIESLDLRVLKGLHVFIHTDTYTEQASKLFSALKEFADYVCLVVLSWDEDFGIEWIRT